MSLDEQNSEALKPATSVLKTTFLRMLFQFFKHMDTHAAENKIFDQSLAALLGVLQQLMNELGSVGVHLTFRGEIAYVNQKSVRPSPREFHIYRHLSDFFRKRQLRGIRILSHPKSENLRTFLWLIGKSEGHAADQMNAQLKTSGLHEFEIEPLLAARDASSGSAVDVELAIAALYKQIHKFIEIVFDSKGTSAVTSTTPIQPALAELSSIGDEDLVQLLRLISVKRYERPLPYRAVNACFLATAWTRSLRLPMALVTEIAGAALLHGLVEVTTTDKEKNPAETKAQILSIIQTLQSAWPISDLQLLCSLEWFHAIDHSGTYAVGPLRCRPHFISRMVRIVADFERLTTYSKGAVTYLPEEAIAEMLKNSTHYDSTLLKIFVNWLGLYPLGTFVELQTGEVAQIFSGASNPLSFQRPVVRIIRDVNGKALTRPVICDLSEMDTTQTFYKKTIKRTLKSDEIPAPEGHRI